MFGLLIRRRDNEIMSHITFTFPTHYTVDRDAYGHVFYTNETKSYLISLIGSNDEGHMFIVP